MLLVYENADVRAFENDYDWNTHSGMNLVITLFLNLGAEVGKILLFGISFT
jgi:hypothetical protein